MNKIITLSLAYIALLLPTTLWPAATKADTTGQAPASAIEKKAQQLTLEAKQLAAAAAKKEAAKVKDDTPQALAKTMKSLNERDQQLATAFVRNANLTLHSLGKKSKHLMMASQKAWVAGIRLASEQAKFVEEKIRLSTANQVFKKQQKNLAKKISPKSPPYSLSAKATSLAENAAGRLIQSHAPAKKIKDADMLSQEANDRLALIKLIRSIITSGMHQDDHEKFYKDLLDELEPDQEEETPATKRK